jgi:hypothetical protein
MLWYSAGCGQITEVTNCWLKQYRVPWNILWQCWRVSMNWEWEIDSIVPLDGTSINNTSLLPIHSGLISQGLGLQSFPAMFLQYVITSKFTRHYSSDTNIDIFSWSTSKYSALYIEAVCSFETSFVPTCPDIVTSQKTNINFRTVVRTSDVPGKLRNELNDTRFFLQWTDISFADKCIARWPLTPI